MEKNATLSVRSGFKAIISIIILHLIWFDIRHLVPILKYHIVVIWANHLHVPLRFFLGIEMRSKNSGTGAIVKRYGVKLLLLLAAAIWKLRF